VQRDEHVGLAPAEDQRSLPLLELRSGGFGLVRLLRQEQAAAGEQEREQDGGRVHVRFRRCARKRIARDQAVSVASLSWPGLDGSVKWRARPGYTQTWCATSRRPSRSRSSSTRGGRTQGSSPATCTWSG